MCYSSVTVCVVRQGHQETDRKRNDSETESRCVSFLNGCKRDRETKTVNVIF